MDFTGKIAVVTGAGGGIGGACVKKLTDNGAKVALVDLTAELAHKTVEKLGLTDEQAFCVGADVTSEEQVKAAVAKIVEHYGTVHKLVCAAGIPGPSARLEDYPYATARKVVDINFWGTFLMVQNIIPMMQAQHDGAIVVFGSCSGMCGYPYESVYGVTKAAMIQFAKNVANENGGNGVRINAISPGWCDTNMMKTVVDSYVDVGIANTSDNVTLGPMGRASRPEEQANVICFLLSDEASYVNGSNFLNDGGMTLG